MAVQPVSFKQHKYFQTPPEKNHFFCIDAHTCGNPVRVVIAGGPALHGVDMSQMRQDFLKNYDWIRKGLMFEPRGHDMMSGSILYPPNNPENDLGILFIETSGCLPMCGHGTIGTVTVVIEEGLVQPKKRGIINLETPAGLVRVEYDMDDSRNQQKVRSVKLTNVPSFLARSGLQVDLPPLGSLTIDVSYGGNFYAIVDIQENFEGLERYSAGQLVNWSRSLRSMINEKYSFVHPQNETIFGCSHILWGGHVLDPASSARNAVFYGDKAIDRSPCGTGTSARMAQWFARGKLSLGEKFIHESIIGSKFTGRIETLTEVAGQPAIVPSIEGWAKVYGYNQISIDPEDDPYAYGFQVI